MIIGKFNIYVCDIKVMINEKFTQIRCDEKSFDNCYVKNCKSTLMINYKIQFNTNKVQTNTKGFVMYFFLKVFFKSVFSYKLRTKDVIVQFSDIIFMHFEHPYVKK